MITVENKWSLLSLNQQCQQNLSSEIQENIEEIMEDDEVRFNRLTLSYPEQNAFEDDYEDIDEQEEEQEEENIK